MKNFLLGIVIGILLIILFIYFGGGRVLKSMGGKTIEVGERVEVYEKKLKEATQDLIKKKKERIEKEIKKKK